MLSNRLSISNFKAIQREESYEEQIRDLSARLKDVSIQERYVYIFWRPFFVRRHGNDRQG